MVQLKNRWSNTGKVEVENRQDFVQNNFNGCTIINGPDWKLMLGLFGIILLAMMAGLQPAVFKEILLVIFSKVIAV